MNANPSLSEDKAHLGSSSVRSMHMRNEVGESMCKGILGLRASGPQSPILCEASSRVICFSDTLNESSAQQGSGTGRCALRAAKRGNPGGSITRVHE